MSALKFVRRFVRQYSDQKTNLVDHLLQRGLVSQVTSPSAHKLVQNPTSVYLGCDPSASSLHLGNLVPLMVLLHFYIRGHTVFPLVGGATGFVGDPSGRQTERQAMEQETRERNIESIHKQMTSVIERGGELAKKYNYECPGSVKPVNNFKWWKDVSMLGFLSTIGRHIRVSQMLARDSVKNRLNSEHGIGFNEFTYQVLQAYDFWHLYKNEGVRVQLGGNDQWGNITAGIDLIGRLKSKESPEPVGMTVPLLTTPSGEKFGKSAGNAVFIQRELTRPYNMYQYLLSSPDSAVEGYLKMFTLIPLDEISTIVQEHNEAPHLYRAQHRLAYEVTSLIHGEEVAANARLVGQIMFENGCEDPAAILAAFESENLVHTLPHSQAVGQTWKNLLATITKKSKSETGRLVQQGSVYVGTKRRVVTQVKVTEDDLEDKLLLVRIGKTDYHAVRVE